MDVLSKFEHFGLALLVEKFWFELEPAGAAAIHQAWMGVSQRRKGKGFIASIKHNDRKLYLGTFDTAVAAARAFDDKAAFLRPYTTNVNFPELLKNEKPPQLNPNLIHQYKFRPGCPVETLVRYGTQRERWIDAEITKVNPTDFTYDLLVLQPKKHGVNPNAVHVPENYIRNKTYTINEVVETRIRYTEKNEPCEIWIAALVTNVHINGSYDITVAEPEKHQVNPLATHVPQDYLRPSCEMSTEWHE